MYYRFTEVAGVGSSLMAPKDIGEGEGRVTYHILVSADRVQRSGRLFFILFEDQNIVSGRIDPGGSRHMQKSKRTQKGSKFKVVILFPNQHQIEVLVVSIPTVQMTLKSKLVWRR